jgi:L-iditol 2-dehydrogenase
VIAGIPSGDDSVVPASVTRRKGLDLRFSRRMNRVYPEAIALVASGRLSLDGVVTAELSLDAAREALATAARREGGKVIVRPS